MSQLISCHSYTPLLSYCYTAIILFCNAAQCLSLVAQALGECDFTSRVELDAALRQVAKELGVSIRNFMLLCRLAITGVKVYVRSLCVRLCNLTSVLGKRCLHTAIRSRTLSFPLIYSWLRGIYQMGLCIVIQILE